MKHKKMNKDRLFRNYITDLCYRVMALHERTAEQELKKLIGDGSTKLNKRTAKHVEGFLRIKKNGQPTMVTKLPKHITCPIPMGGWK